jgi:dihydroflavonol-4-reductase
MKAYVTGATGFIGGHLVRRLVERGDEVKALIRDPAKGEPLKKLGVELVIGDILDNSSFEGTLEGSDVLYHLGNVARWWLPEKSLFYRINVEGTRSIFSEALKAKVPKVIYVSSLATGAERKGEMITEKTEHTGELGSHYSRSKYLGEKEALKMCREEGLPLVVLNPGVVFGPGDLKQSGKTVIDFMNGRFPVMMFEDSYVPLVYIDDTINSHILALEKGKIGERYIIVGYNVTVGELFRVLSEISGTPAPKRKISWGFNPYLQRSPQSLQSIW